MADLLVCTLCTVWMVHVFFYPPIPNTPSNQEHHPWFTHHFKGTVCPVSDFWISRPAHICTVCAWHKHTHWFIPMQKQSGHAIPHSTWRETYTHTLLASFPVTLTTHVPQSQFTHSLLNTSAFISIIQSVRLELSVACQWVKSVALNCFPK